MKKRLVKYISLVLIITLITVLIIFIYNNLFAGIESSRFKDIEKHKLTNNEINSVKDKINELDNIKSVDVYVNSKIIKVLVKTKDDISFEEIKTKATETLASFSEKNLNYYDIEFIVDSSNIESEIYPQIGYKFKKSENFSW